MTTPVTGTTTTAGQPAIDTADAAPVLPANLFVVPSAIWAESYRFGAHRLANAVEHVRRLSQCKDPKEAVSMQLEYLAEAAVEYKLEAKEFQSIVADAMRRAAA